MKEPTGYEFWRMSFSNDPWWLCLAFLIEVCPSSIFSGYIWGKFWFRTFIFNEVRRKSQRGFSIYPRNQIYSECLQSIPNVLDVNFKIIYTVSKLKDIRNKFHLFYFLYIYKDIKSGKKYSKNQFWRHNGSRTKDYYKMDFNKVKYLISKMVLKIQNNNGYFDIHVFDM